MPNHGVMTMSQSPLCHPLECYHNSLLQRSPSELYRSLFVVADLVTSSSFVSRSYSDYVTASFLSEKKTASVLPRYVSLSQFMTMVFDDLDVSSIEGSSSVEFKELYKQASCARITQAQLEMLLATLIARSSSSHLYLSHQSDYVTLFTDVMLHYSCKGATCDWLENPFQALTQIIASLHLNQDMHFEGNMLLQHLEDLKDLSEDMMAIFSKHSLALHWSQTICQIKVCEWVMAKGGEVFSKLFSDYSHIDLWGMCHLSGIEKWLLQVLKSYDQVKIWDVFSGKLSSEISSSSASKPYSSHKALSAASLTDNQHPGPEHLSPEHLSPEHLNHSHAALQRCESHYQELDNALSFAASCIACGTMPHKIAILLPQGDRDYKDYIEYLAATRSSSKLKISYLPSYSLSSSPLGSCIAGVSFFLSSFQRKCDFYQLIAQNHLFTFLTHIYSKHLQKSLDLSPDDGAKIINIFTYRLKEWVCDYMQKRPLDESYRYRSAKTSSLKTSKTELIIDSVHHLFEFIHNDKALSLNTIHIIAEDFWFFALNHLKHLTLSYPHNTQASLSESVYLDHVYSFCLKYLHFEAFPHRENCRVACQNLFDDILYLRSLTDPSQVSQEPAKISSFQPTKTLKELLKWMNRYPIQPSSSPFKGIQVMPFAKATLLPFEVVIVCGVSRGLIQKPRWDGCMSPYWQKITQLATEPSEQDMESTVFAMLWQHTPRLLCTYTECKSHYEMSSFVSTAFFSSGKACTKTVFTSQDFSSLLDYFSLTEASYNKKATDIATDNSNPLVDTPAAMFSDFKPRASLWDTLSASSLKHLIHCSYAFFLQKNSISDLGLPQNHEFLMIGQWLDKVMDIFFKGSYVPGNPPTHQVIAPLCADDDLSFESLFQRLQQISHRLLKSTSFIKPSGYYDHRFSHLKAMADWFSKLFHHCGWPHEVDTQYDFKELKTYFVKGENSSDKTLMSGKIDLMLTMKDITFIIDYKSNNLPKSKLIKQAKEPQLFFYHQAVQGDGNARNTVLMYYSIQKQTPLLVYVPKHLKDLVSNVWSKTPLLSEESDLLDIQEQLYDDWQYQKKAIQDHRKIEAITGDHCEYCQYKGVCRKHMS